MTVLGSHARPSPAPGIDPLLWVPCTWVRHACCACAVAAVDDVGGRIGRLVHIAHRAWAELHPGLRQSTTVAGFERYDAHPTLSTICRYAVSVGARLRTSVIDDCDTCADGRAFSAAITGLPFDSMPVVTHMPAPGAWTADPKRMTLHA